MPYVRSQATYTDFITGRDVDSALHREDGAAGYCIAFVEFPRAGDETITEQQYATEKAAIVVHNAAIPATPQLDPAAVQKAAFDALATPLVAAVEGVLTARQMAPMTPVEQAKVRDGAVYLASRGQFGKQA